jgi:radical SAM protein with 4Fe4S-binding SPASM domain
MKLPNDAFINVTIRCNAKCVMCDNWKRPPTEELAPEEFSKLPKSLRYINLSGGEPFLRDDLAEIVQVLHTSLNKPKIDISTNGFLTDKIEVQMKKILSIGARVGVRISVDGIGARHDQVRGTKGAYDKAIASVKLLQKMGLKDLGIGCVASNYNIDQLQEVVKLAKRLKVDFMCAGVVQNSELTFSKNNKPIQDLAELKRQLDYVATEQLKTFSPRNWVRAYIGSGLYYFASTGTRKIPCSAGISFFFMTPNGDIYPDMVCGYKLGNIKTESFEEIWFSDHATEFRNKLNDISQCPTPCWMTCTVFPWMRRHKLQVAKWMFFNKIKAHFGLTIAPCQSNSRNPSDVK